MTSSDDGRLCCLFCLLNAFFFVYYVVNFTTLLIVGCVADLVPIFEIAFVQGVSLRRL